MISHLSISFSFIDVSSKFYLKGALMGFKLDRRSINYLNNLLGLYFCNYFSKIKGKGIILLQKYEYIILFT